VRIELTVNGEAREADVWPGESLLYALRERLGLPGSKNACEQGECGSCSVLLDGTLVCACLVLAAQADGHEVVTVEGSPGTELHRVQEAFVEAGAVQCGFCTPGSSSRPPTCSARRRARARTRSARRSPATSAAARATRRSSTPSGWRRAEAMPLRHGH
jgi:aerobic-type carbon monoxide dehydrogenase small subunit (CoxS/CutS family)